MLHNLITQTATCARPHTLTRSKLSFNQTVFLPCKTLINMILTCMTENAQQEFLGTIVLWDIALVHSKDLTLILI